MRLAAPHFGGGGRGRRQPRGKAFDNPWYFFSSFSCCFFLDIYLYLFFEVCFRSVLPPPLLLLLLPLWISGCCAFCSTRVVVKSRSSNHTGGNKVASAGMAKHAHSPQELSDPLLPQLPAIPPRLSPSHADSDSAPSSLSASALPVTPPPLLMPTAEVDETGGKTRPIGILHFAAVSFFLVAGGPFGNEYCVIYGGPLLTLVGFVLMPLMWSVPQALMTAELSTALPDNGGYVLWAQYVFGDFVGFVAGANGLLSSLVDSTLYPTLLATYVLALVRGGAFVPSNSSATDMVGALPDGLFEAAAVENFTTSAPAPPSPGNPIDWVSTGIALACVAVGFVINITGVQMVSIVSMICVLIIILPFIVYLCAMAPEIFASNQTYANFTDIPVFQLLPWPDVQWGAFFSTLIWSFTGYDTVGCIAGEVNAAQRTFILGSLVTIFLVILTYAVPIVSMLMVHPNLTTWEDGALLTFLGDVGTWLSVWGCAAAAVQNMGWFVFVMAPRCLCWFAKCFCGPTARVWKPRCISNLCRSVCCNCASFLHSSWMAGAFCLWASLYLTVTTPN